MNDSLFSAVGQLPDDLVAAAFDDAALRAACQKRKKRARAFLSLAACFCLLLSAFPVIRLVRGGSMEGDSMPPQAEAPDADAPNAEEDYSKYYDAMVEVSFSSTAPDTAAVTVTFYEGIIEKHVTLYIEGEGLAALPAPIPVTGKTVSFSLAATAAEGQLTLTLRNEQGVFDRRIFSFSQTEESLFFSVLSN